MNDNVFDDLERLLNKQETLINKQGKMINLMLSIIDTMRNQLTGVELNELLYKKQIADLQEELQAIAKDYVDVKSREGGQKD